jgi:threonine dehydrogenase-like Zn-dependent dehydrogenase
MRQLTCTAPGLLEWRDVASPELGDGAAALIRPVAVARCEIDPLLVGAGPASPDGFAVGHEAVAEVMQTGPGTSTVAVGQLVFCSFQVSCGRCVPCRGGRAQHVRAPAWPLAHSR